ncbi:helix-turn-helix domain-containing protein [Propionibacteriaceae bacterium G57]|uniref:helix-turn-helix domain-containing protein n=1 Tax=Aestuariimicrobium sp. G57 TaxID=3418485 RepID=UPI003DA75FF4
MAATRARLETVTRAQLVRASLITDARILIDRGWSVDRAARTLGVSPATIRRWFDRG